MTNKVAQTQTAIHELIAQRWSPRAFDSSAPIPKESLTALLEAARWAPSCFGDEPWRFIVCNKFDDETSWGNALGTLAEKNQFWARNAPLLIIAVADSQFMKNGNPNRWGQYDTGAAAENLCLQATAVGLAAHQMGGFDVGKARDAFNIPDRYTPMAVIAVGKPASIETLDPIFRDSEAAERSRAPLGERFFHGQWGKSIET